MLSIKNIFLTANYAQICGVKLLVRFFVQIKLKIKFYTNFTILLLVNTLLLFNYCNKILLVQIH